VLPATCSLDSPRLSSTRFGRMACLTCLAAELRGALSQLSRIGAVDVSGTPAKRAGAASQPHRAIAQVDCVAARLGTRLVASLQFQSRDRRRRRRLGARPMTLVGRLAFRKRRDHEEPTVLAGVVELHQRAVEIVYCKRFAREEKRVDAVGSYRQQAGVELA